MFILSKKTTISVALLGAMLSSCTQFDKLSTGEKAGLGAIVAIPVAIGLYKNYSENKAEEAKTQQAIAQRQIDQENAAKLAAQQQIAADEIRKKQEKHDQWLNSLSPKDRADYEIEMAKMKLQQQ
jgi:apolipoprotein N-acyltransferase